MDTETFDVVDNPDLFSLLTLNTDEDKSDSHILYNFYQRKN